MKPEIDTVGEAILKGACKTEAKDIAIDLSQFGLVELLGRAVMDEIPISIIKCIVASYKGPIAIRDQLFLRKVARFLAGVPDFTPAEREAFLAKHLVDDKRAKKLGETLVLVLDRLDDMEKPHMVAQVFGAFVRAKIPFETFRRLTTAIDLASVDDLDEFINLKPPTGPPGKPIEFNTQILRTNLARTGLVSLPPFSQTSAIAGFTFRENEHGKVFREIMLEAKAPST